MGLLYLMGESAFNPRTLFANGEQGLWLDPSQMSTMFTDSAGTTSVTAAGDPVGLILDQSRGGLGALGPELITSGDGTSLSGWVAGLFACTSAVSGGEFRITHSGTNFGSICFPFTTVVGRFYRFSATYVGGTGDGRVIKADSTNFTNNRVDVVGSQTVMTPGTSTIFFQATSTTTYVHLLADNSAGEVSIYDNISVREVPGNHAYQSTSSARPTLARIPSSGRRNLLTRTEEFDNAAWTQAGVTVSANAGTDPLGTVLADRLVETAANSEHRIQNSTTLSVTSGTVYTASIYAKAGEVTIVRVGFDDQVKLPGRAFFNLSLGTVSFTEAGSATITAVGNGWYRCTITGTCGTSHSSRLEINLVQSGTTAIYAGNTSNGLLLWGAQLETGSTATNYQKVVATTDVTESGVGDLWHLVFDGSDDSLVTNSVDFTGTDEMTVIAGLRKLSDAASATFVEASSDAGSNSGAFAVYAPRVANAAVEYRSRGTLTVTSNEGIASAAPTTLVFTGQSDISDDSLTVRKNGVQANTSAADQGTGNYGNHILYIGRRGGTTLPYNGHLYQLIVRGKTTPTGKLLEAERFTAKKTGLSI